MPRRVVHLSPLFYYIRDWSLKKRVLLIFLTKIIIYCWYSNANWHHMHSIFCEATCQICDQSLQDTTIVRRLMTWGAQYWVWCGEIPTLTIVTMEINLEESLNVSVLWCTEIILLGKWALCTVLCKLSWPNRRTKCYGPVIWNMIKHKLPRALFKCLCPRNTHCA